MRLLYVTAFYPPDFTSGATMQVQQVAVRMAAAGHDVHVFSGAIQAGLTDGQRRDETIDGVTVHWLGSPGWTDPVHDVNWSNPVATAAAASLLDELRPDVVHAHTLQTLGGGPLAEAHDRDIRTIVTMHDMWWWCALLFLVDRELRPCPIVTDAGVCPCARDAAWRTARARSLRRVLDDVGEVLVPSATMRDLVVANGLDPARVTIDPNHVHLPTRRSGGDVPPHPAGTRPQVGGVRFAFLGGDHPLKGTDVLLAAARRLGDVPGWTLTAYGVEARPDLADSPVTFRPPFDADARGDVLAAADVVIIASVARESFSLVAREALAAGLPVITSDCLGPEEVVHDGVNGLVVPTGDERSLASAMGALIDDRARLAALTDGARRSDVEVRSPAQHAAALAERYATAPPPTVRRWPSSVVHVVDRGHAARLVRAEHAAEALALRGIVTELVDHDDPDLAARTAGADAVIVHAERVDPDRLGAQAPLLWDAGAGARAGVDVVVVAMAELAAAVGRRTGLRHAVVADGVGIEDIRAAYEAERRRRPRWWRRRGRRSATRDDPGQQARVAEASRRETLLHRGPHSTANAWLAALDIARHSRSERADIG